MTAVKNHEKARRELLGRLQAAKDQTARNRLGQFATPAPLASEIVRLTLSRLPRNGRIRYLEPGFGTGPFYSALLQSVSNSRIDVATGYEIDAQYVQMGVQLWGDTGLQLHHADFTAAAPPDNEADKYNIVVCNPRMSATITLVVRRNRNSRKLYCRDSGSA